MIELIALHCDRFSSFGTRFHFFFSCVRSHFPFLVFFLPMNRSSSDERLIVLCDQRWLPVVRGDRLLKWFSLLILRVVLTRILCLLDCNRTSKCHCWAQHFYGLDIFTYIFWYCFLQTQTSLCRWWCEKTFFGKWLEHLLPQCGCFLRIWLCDCNMVLIDNSSIHCKSMMAFSLSISLSLFFHLFGFIWNCCKESF